MDLTFTVGFVCFSVLHLLYELKDYAFMYKREVVRRNYFLNKLSILNDFINNSKNNTAWNSVFDQISAMLGFAITYVYQHTMERDINCKIIVLTTIIVMCAIAFKRSGYS